MKHGFLKYMNQKRIAQNPQVNPGHLCKHDMMVHLRLFLIVFLTPYHPCFHLDPFSHGACMYRDGLITGTTVLQQHCKERLY